MRPVRSGQSSRGGVGLKTIMNPSHELLTRVSNTTAGHVVDAREWLRKVAASWLGLLRCGRFRPGGLSCLAHGARTGRGWPRNEGGVCDAVEPCGGRRGLRGTDHRLGPSERVQLHGVTRSLTRPGSSSGARAATIAVSDRGCSSGRHHVGGHGPASQAASARGSDSDGLGSPTATWSS